MNILEKDFNIRFSDMNFKQEIKNLIAAIQKMDRKVIIIFISVAILQTVSWYFTSRRFFRENLFYSFPGLGDPYLIEFLFWFIGDFLVFIGLGILIIKFLLKENIRNYGLTFGDYKTGLTISVVFILVMLPLVWLASSSPEFNARYPHLLSARDDLKILIIYEAGMLIYMVGWEFVWRGFMLFGLEEKFGYYAVLIQMLPFVILHNGKPAPETFSAILGGIALGILALRTRSIYYCVLVHISVMFSIDIISTLRYKVQDYGVGFSSLVNIIGNLF